jgi:hypothetical protein
MITCFARKFLGGEIAPATALRTMRARDDGGLLASPARGSPQPRAGLTGSNVPFGLFELPSALARYLFLRSWRRRTQDAAQERPCSVEARATRVGPIDASCGTHLCI